VTEEEINNGRLVRVDLASNTIIPVVSGLNQPGHLVVRGTQAFVAGNIGDPVTLMRIDLNDGTVAAVSEELGGGLSGVAVNDTLTQAHVVNFGSSTVSRVDIDPSSPTFKQVVQVVSGLSGPRDIVIDSTGTVAYITEQKAGRLIEVNIDPASPGYGMVSTLADGMNGPRGLALDSAAGLAYVAQEWGNELSAVDLSTGVVTSVISSLPGVRGVAIDSTQKVAWVTINQDLVAVDINLASPAYGAKVNLVNGGPPLDGARGLDLNADETIAYVVSEFSGKLSRVNIDPASPTYGVVTEIADDLLILTNVDVNKNETLAYVTREAGPKDPPFGRDVVSRVDLTTGKAITVTDQVGQPTNIVLSQDEKEGYVVDMHFGAPGKGGLYRVNLATGAVTPVATRLNVPYAMAVNQAETLAYLGTLSTGPSGETGNLLRIDIQSGQVFTVTTETVVVSGITVNADETLAYVTDFGEGECMGQLVVVDIDPASPTYGIVTPLLTGLCGPHDVRLNAAETAAYVVEVDARRLIRVDL